MSSLFAGIKFGGCNRNPLARLGRATLALGAATTLAATAFGGGSSTGWTGATSNDWFTGTNWTNGVPGSGSQVTVDTSAPNGAVIAAASGQAFNLTLSDNTSLNPGSLTITNGGSLAVTSTVVISNQFFGNGTLLVTDTGSTISVGGDLSVGKATSGSLTISNGANITANATTRLGVDFLGHGFLSVSGANSSATFNGDLYVGADGTGDLTVSTNGTVHANANVAVGNLHSGTLTVNSGGGFLTTGNIGVGNGFGASGNIVVTGAGSVLDVWGSLTSGASGHANITVENGGIVDIVGNLSTGVDFGATSVLTINTGGTVTVGDKLTLTHGSTSTQSTVNLNGGELRVGGTDGIQAGSGNLVAFNFNGGTLTTHDANLTSGVNLNLAGNGTIHANGFNATLSGVISGSGQLVKTGGHILTLAGNNTYTGGTLISAGIVVLTDHGAGSALGTGDVNVSSFGGLAGVGRVLGNVVVDGHLSPGLSAGLLTFNGNVALTLPTSELQIEIGGLTRGTQYDALDIGGNLSLNGVLDVAIFNGFAPAAGDSFLLFDVTGTIVGSFSSYDLPALGGGLVWDTSALATTGVLAVTVPEPAEYALAAAALAAAGALVRRRKLTV